MFAKVFTQILDSSLAQDYQVRLVFEDFLKLADVNGVVDMTPESIARRTNVPIEIVVKGIKELESTDLQSRSPEYDGKRIVRLDDHREWGWFIVNYTKYRGIASSEQKRERTLSRVRKHREISKLQSVTPCNAPVTPDNASNAMQKKRQRKKQTDKTTPQASPAVPLVPDELDTEDFARAWDAWAQFREGKGNPILPVEEAKIHKELSKIGHDNAIKLISEAIIMNLDKIPSPHQKFIDRWSTEYKARFGQTYFFTGGKDGSAVKRLVSNGLSVDQLVELFTKAWATDAFFCQKAVSICGFASNINQIRAELSKPSQGRPMSDSLNMSSLLTQKRELEKTFVKLQAELQYDHNRTPDKLKAFKEAKDKMSQINAAIEGMNRK